MKVLVIGSGGREHVLCWKIKQSSKVSKVYCAPGNGGIANVAECVNIDALDASALIDFAKQKKIDLTVVGPEAPLVEGIVDLFQKENLRIFGPRKLAAQLEGSKVFAKEFMKKWKIPTALFNSFSNLKEAHGYLNKASLPLVVKADGLAAGKGVFVCATRSEAQDALKQIMEQKIFDEAGSKVVIEECLKGKEVSILAISDGTNYIMLEPSQDHKRVFDDDVGPNTGGMGAYSPTPVVTKSLLRQIERNVIEPSIRGMREEGTPFVGVLYAGLMITEDGPRVLEFNVRFGDPETQVVLPRLKSDLVEAMLAACQGELDKVRLEWDTKACVCVVMCSGGYPGKYEKGKEIFGLAEVESLKDTFVFHAGTKKEGTKLVTSGGRVLGVTSLGDNIEEAIRKAYESVDKIKFDRCFFRRDIATKALKKTADAARSKSRG